MATSGSSCTASGVGNISDSIALATGGYVTYTATVVVAAGATGSIVKTATIGGGTVPDPHSANNVASATTDIEVPIFANGFE